MHMISKEKRAFKRVSHKFYVQYKRHGCALPQMGPSVTENISLGGMYFISLESFDIGTILDCRITTATAGECSYEARVVRCEEIGTHMLRTYGTAVEFVKAEGDSEKRLRAAL